MEKAFYQAFLRLKTMKSFFKFLKSLARYKLKEDDNSLFGVKG